MVVGVLIGLLCGVRSAQTQDDERERRQRERLEREAIDLIPAKRHRSLFESLEDVDIEYGGWLRVTRFAYEDAVARRRAVNYDLRFWSELKYLETHRLYLRARTNLLDYQAGDQYHPNRDTDYDEPDIDQAFYELDLIRLLEAESDRTYPAELSLAVGRRFFYIGRGLVYAQRNDGFEASGRYRDLGFRLLATKTISTRDDVDQSRPDAGTSRRWFFGGELQYLGLSRHEPYVFFLAQRDRNDRHPADASQLYHYRSDYYGAGVSGDLQDFFHWITGDTHGQMPRISYYVERVLEHGRSAANGTSQGTGAIRARSLQAGLEYLVEAPGKPRIFVDYLFGSGDPNRSSVTNTQSGNQLHTTDRGFLGFGYADTGLALLPRVANLHVYRIGFAFKPIEHEEYCRDLEVGASYFIFRKDRSNGAISDPTADLSHSKIGEELDLFINWRVFSDLMVSAEFGYFMPGAAFGSYDSDRPFFGLSLTYSF